MKEILWFRNDLRLSDNPALQAIVNEGNEVVALYILEEQRQLPIGGAAMWWLHHSLIALQQAIASWGGQLLLRRGDVRMQLQQVIQETGAVAVRWNRRYEPEAIHRDTMLKRWLQEEMGVATHSYGAALLFEPWQVLNGEGKPYRVFSPFWRAALAQTVPPPLPPLDRYPFCTSAVRSDVIEEWRLLPTQPDWAGGLRQYWQPGEAGGQQRLKRFLRQGLYRYKEERNCPAALTSELSPHLHFGEVSVRAVWHQTLKVSAGCSKEESASVDCFLSEMGWREFSHSLLYHFPHTIDAPFQEKFSNFPWKEDASAYNAWCRGATGYPIVDAGMRQLWAIGWMHNRVRMIVASFLTKDLMIHWKHGAAWFWDTLVDADLANNTASWQWVAGSGADAAPYFRIFSPLLQGKKFDPEGRYIRTWIPELANVPQSFIHEPWRAPNKGDYPDPIVDHSEARKRALEAYSRLD